MSSLGANRNASKGRASLASNDNAGRRGWRRSPFYQVPPRKASSAFVAAKRGRIGLRSLQVGARRRRL